jgi:hypothetical protein
MTNIRYDMSNEEYHASDALSASGAKTIALQSLFDYKYAEREHKAAFDVGTATHTFVFEPLLADTVWCGPETRRGKAWTEMKADADAAGALLLTDGDYRLAKGMAEAVRANPDAAQLLTSNMTCEASVFARDHIYGVDMRARPDGWRKDIATLIDLKTTVDPSPEGFAKQAANFGYHIQDQFYRRVMTLAGHEIDRFVFIAVGKSAPHKVGVYELNWRTLDEGNAAVKYALEAYAHAQETGLWNYGYEELQTLEIPPWAYKFTQAN